jgi:NADH-quinone oxidoreductase subunit F
MPAAKLEIEEAVEEGIEILPLTAPISFAGEGKVTGILCSHMELGEFDASGRRKPKVKAGDQTMLAVDLVIAAVSQSADLSFVSKGEIEVTRWDTFVVNDDTMETSVPGVFAGGDIVRGADTAIQAIADGKKAAQNIAIYLGDTGELNKGAPIDIPEVPVDEDEIEEHGRFGMEMLPAEQRIKNFDEVAQGYHKLGAMAESMRCLHCDRR